MPILNLSCARCGSSLELPAEIRFVTCLACGEALEIFSSQQVAFTSSRRHPPLASVVPDPHHEAKVQNESDRRALLAEEAENLKAYLWVDQYGRISTPMEMIVRTSLLSVTLAIVEITHIAYSVMHGGWYERFMIDFVLLTFIAITLVLIANQFESAKEFRQVREEFCVRREALELKIVIDQGEEKDAPERLKRRLAELEKDPGQLVGYYLGIDLWPVTLPKLCHYSALSTGLSLGLLCLSPVLFLWISANFFWLGIAALSALIIFATQWLKVLKMMDAEDLACRSRQRQIIALRERLKA